MKTIGCVEVNRLSEEELAFVSKKIAEAHPIITACAERLCEGKVKKFWREFMQGKLRSQVSMSERAAVQSVVDLVETISGNIVLAVAEKARSFHRSFSHVSFDDFFQEGMMLIGYCLFAYDGSNELSTYLLTSIHKHLINFARRSSPLGTVSPPVIQRRKELRKRMEAGQTYDEAVSEMGLSPTKLKSLSGSMTKLHSIHELNKDDRYVFTNCLAAPEEDEPVLEEDTRLQQALEFADLNEFERDLIEELMNSDVPGFQSRVAARHTSPRTGKAYTRAAAGVAYHRAIEKIKEIYLDMEANPLKYTELAQEELETQAA